MIPFTILRVARMDLATMDPKSPEIQILFSLQGNTYLLPLNVNFNGSHACNKPGTNPNIAAIGSPDVATPDVGAANCVTVLLSA